MLAKDIRSRNRALLLNPPAPRSQIGRDLSVDLVLPPLEVEQQDAAAEAQQGAERQGVKSDDGTWDVTSDGNGAAGGAGYESPPGAGQCFAAACAAAELAYSSHAAAGSITGNTGDLVTVRSEERHVGKDRRSRCTPHP